MFCKLKGLESLGFAKTIDEGAQFITVEYFDTPLKTEVRTVKRSDVVVTRLGVNTRIYVRADENCWSVGRVLHDDGTGIEIRLQGGQDIHESYDNVRVRWRNPISDPFDFLSCGITETPRYAKARNAFRDSYIQQRGKTGGISALLSSTIELAPHQIDVVQRVLRDPAQRYLLADEVGLGKTIEAGIVIRQAVLDDPREHKIVVVVPAALVSQWRGELSLRFGLGPYIDVSVFIASNDDRDSLHDYLADATFLVIDEAHHIAAPTDECEPLYQVLRGAALVCPQVLLLSATPVLRNESGFLRMLHLLDPVIYRLEDEDEFRIKIANRQFLAEAVASVDPANVLQLAPILESLESLLPDDRRLADLSGIVKAQLSGRIEADEPLIRALRVLRGHLSETYRLHRRILRNRRKRVEGLTPKRAGFESIPIKSDTRGLFENELEGWRINALASMNGMADDAARDFEDIYWKALSFISGQPGSFREFCASSLTGLVAQQRKWKFEGERSHIELLANLADRDAEFVSAKIDALVESIPSWIAKAEKVVVFCTGSAIADQVSAQFCKELRTVRTYRHKVTSEDEDQWQAFLKLPDASVLICDESAEEGLNLQGGRKRVVHFDLPLEPNRIEQRLGRIDRFGSGQPIRSVVMIADTPMQRAWLHALGGGLRLFDRSVSSLQYLIDERLHSLKSNAFFHGLEAFLTLSDDLMGKEGLVETELRLIDQQDTLDELEPTSETAIEHIRDVDDDWKAVQMATDQWAIETLLFEVADKTPGVNLAPSFRFGYVPPGNGGSTLIPFSSFLEDFLAAIDYEAPRGGARRPLSFAHSYRRQTAINARTRVLRYGDEFMEALKRFADSDDRGRTYVTWRSLSEQSPIQGHAFYFQVCFIVEGDVHIPPPVLEMPGSIRKRTSPAFRNAIRRRVDSMLAPLVIDLWLDEEGSLLDSDFVNEYLTISTAKAAGSKWVDTNLKAARLTRAIREVPEIFGTWKERCLRMRDAAAALARESDVLRQAIKIGARNASIDKDAREAYYASRLGCLNAREALAERRDFDREMSICDSVSSAIANPTIKIDVVGAVILADSKCPVTDQGQTSV